MVARTQRGGIMIELTMALGILSAVVIPLAFSITYEMRVARAYYFQAVAMEIVDGEMEILAAGEWRTFDEGSHPYTVRADAAQNLPPGRFVLAVRGPKLSLEWIPERRGALGPLRRETTLP